MRLLFSIFFFFALQCFNSSHAQNDGQRVQAMGLTFGQSFQEANSRGLVADELNREGRLTTFRATDVPQEPSDTDSVTLVFDDTLGLQKIMWTSKNISDDPTGSTAKERFQTIKAALIQKYGAAPYNGLEKTGLTLFQEYDEFYQCLDYSGCGLWVALWEGDYGSTSLSIESTGRRGEGWVQIIYEGPEWADIVGQIELETQKSDAGVF